MCKTKQFMYDQFYDRMNVQTAKYKFNFPSYFDKSGNRSKCIHLFEIFLMHFLIQNFLKIQHNLLKSYTWHAFIANLIFISFNLRLLCHHYVFMLCIFQGQFRVVNGPCLQFSCCRLTDKCKDIFHSKLCRHAISLFQSFSQTVLTYHIEFPI